MTQIFETDALQVSAQVIGDTEARTGVLMPGDERRILMDSAAYAIAHQNQIGQIGFDSLDPDNATGDLLTARGKAEGVFRNAGRPVEIHLRCRKVPAAPVTIPAGTKVTIGGVELVVPDQENLEGAAGSFHTITATGAAEHPDAAQAAAQNSLNPYSGDVGEFEPPVSGLGSVSVAPEDQPIQQRAEADDQEDDALFRSRIDDALERHRSYTALLRSYLPDAAFIQEANGGPGIVILAAIRLDKDGYATTYPIDALRGVQAALMQDPDRLHGDYIDIPGLRTFEVKASIVLWCSRGASGAVRTAVRAGLPEFCRQKAEIGSMYDTGDLIRHFDGIPGVRYLELAADNSTLDGQPVTLSGNPRRYQLPGDAFIRMTPTGFNITYREVD